METTESYLIEFISRMETSPDQEIATVERAIDKYFETNPLYKHQEKKIKKATYDLINAFYDQQEF